jgi:hypothetical protein
MRGRSLDRFLPGIGNAYCSEMERSTDSSASSGERCAAPPVGEVGPRVTTGALVSNSSAFAACAAAAAKGSSAGGASGDPIAANGSRGGGNETSAVGSTGTGGGVGNGDDGVRLREGAAAGNVNSRSATGGSE